MCLFNLVRSSSGLAVSSSTWSMSSSALVRSGVINWYLGISKCAFAGLAGAREETKARRGTGLISLGGKTKKGRFLSPGIRIRKFGRTDRSEPDPRRR